MPSPKHSASTGTQQPNTADSQAQEQHEWRRMQYDVAGARCCCDVIEYLLVGALIYRKPLRSITNRLGPPNKGIVCFETSSGEANPTLCNSFTPISCIDSTWLKSAEVTSVLSVMCPNTLAMPSSELTIPLGFPCCSAIVEARSRRRPMRSLERS